MTASPSDLVLMTREGGVTTRIVKNHQETMATDVWVAVSA